MACSTPATPAGDASVSDATKAHPAVRMLVGGVYHDYDVLPGELAARVKAKGPVGIAIVRDVSSLEDLRGIDVLWVHTCLADIDLSQRARDSIAAFVDGGGGLVAMHCALASFRSFYDWRLMIGGWVPAHEPYGTYEVRTVGSHPILTGVPQAFSVTDEPYYVDERQSDSTVLVETTRSLVNLDGGSRAGLEPHVWTRTRGAGRIVTITFGHDAASQKNDAVVTLLYNALLWTGKH